MTTYQHSQDSSKFSYKIEEEDLHLATVQVDNGDETDYRFRTAQEVEVSFVRAKRLITSRRSVVYKNQIFISD